MSKYIKSLKRVISDGNNGKTLEEYDFAVKAENVIVTDNRVSWQMICDSLKNNTIQNYLKVGDKIDIPTGMNNEFLSFFVLGINTYNGQPKEQLGRTHIDLGCPRMSKILPLINPTININPIFPFGNIQSNTGRTENNINYFTMFDYSFFKDINYNNIAYKNSLMRVLLLDDNNIKSLLKPKMLFLDRRYGISNIVNDRLRDLFPLNKDTVINDLINLSQFSQIASINDSTILDWKDTNLKDPDSSFNDQSFDTAISTFIENHIGYLTHTALKLQRINIKLLYGPVYDDLQANISLMKTAVDILNNSINQPLGFYLFNFIAYLAYFVKKQMGEINQSTDMHLVYNNEISSPLFWSLTEMDIFGKTILGSQLYSQGQLFQYPYFKNLIQKKQFVSSLDQEEKSLMTITPVDGTSNQLVGYSGQNNENLLCPIPINLPTYQDQGGTSNYDVALCFRKKKKKILRVIREPLNKKSSISC